MSCTLAGQTLQVTDWQWDDGFLGSKYQRFAQSVGSNVTSMKSTVFTYGCVHVHTITFIEVNVPWLESAANVFRGLINSNTVVLNSSLNIYNTNGPVNVYILDCTGTVSARDPGEGNAMVRRVQVQIQEA